MKKIVFTSAALASAVMAMDASAQCANGDASQVAVGGFVLQAFTPKCSANVTVVGLDQTSVYKVGAISAKGKTAFNGSTAGGAVAAYTTCATAGACAATEASTAASAAASS